MSVERDPLLSDDLVDLELLDKLDNNRTLIKRYPKTLLRLVGLSRSFDDPNARPTLLKSNASDMGLLDFVKFADPFRVKTEERTLSEGDLGTSTFASNDGSYADELYESQTVNYATAQDVYVPDWNVTNGARLDHLGIFQNFIDHITPPRYWVALRNQSDARFLDNFNINSTQHACMSEEVIGLNKQNVELLGKVSILKSFHEELNSQVSKLEVDYESLRGESAEEAKMREEFTSLQDAATRHFEELSTKLDARISEVKHDMDIDLYPHMLTAIDGQRWVVGHDIRLSMMECVQSLECCSALGKVISLAINKGIQQSLKVGVEHEKAGRSLAQVEAYDPDVENKYVATVKEFENVFFS
nr:putative transposase (putative), gypsy type [Tanacetum cinerariifolium]